MNVITLEKKLFAEEIYAKFFFAEFFFADFAQICKNKFRKIFSLFHP